ncbi:ferredoxin-NADPH reductase [Microbacterium excoecariae]|uniref:ferredoxin-NADPH reductase n=1 Tax=Microbacterium excoecariae TaxID=2715210 RepID=UPI0014074446|nr:ferredoxin-NADPH reductase [Microbacterium excoecariae]NHI16604.1 ferredoxin-NADPH reductase [Microbacterium excoecariae]
MRPPRIGHDAYATAFGAAHLVLVVNALLVVGCAPLVAVLATTDPSLSWPAIACAAALTGPPVTGAFGAFRAHRDGERSVLRPFVRAARAGGWRALAVSAATSATVTVAAADAVLIAGESWAVAVLPALVVVAALALATGAIALAALAEAPRTPLTRLGAVSAAVAVRRWPFSLATLAVAGAQAAVFVAAPALAVGITASACLYVAWAGSRHALTPVLRPEEVPA